MYLTISIQQSEDCQYCKAQMNSAQALTQHLRQLRTLEMYNNLGN